MIQNLTTMKKQRVTAFLDPTLVTRAKVRGALEGLTISKIVERALDAYAPRIEKDIDQHIHLKFVNSPALLAPETGLTTKGPGPKYTKQLVVPR